MCPRINEECYGAVLPSGSAVIGTLLPTIDSCWCLGQRLDVLWRPNSIKLNFHGMVGHIALGTAFGTWGMAAIGNLAGCSLV